MEREGPSGRPYPLHSPPSHEGAAVGIDLLGGGAATKAMARKVLLRVAPAEEASVAGTIGGAVPVPRRVW